MKKLRWGMIGGGLGSMIGPIHRYAARLDNVYDLVAGSFSQDINKSKQLGQTLGLNESRIYPDYQTMLEKEKSLPQEQRIEVISIVTPNHLHFPIAKSALENGFHIILEKPMTLNLEEAIILRDLAKEKNLLGYVLYTYAGYPMIKEMREQIRMGKIGAVRKVHVSFTQGWLSQFNEPSNKQASWRQNPNYAGTLGTMADIGIHAFHLIEYVTGLQTESLFAEINTCVPNRLLDDDGTILLRFSNGTKGSLLASQITIGDSANLIIQVVGEEGSLQWEHTNHHQLKYANLNAPIQIYEAGNNNPYLSEEALANCRLPAGHPEGMIEVFANHYYLFYLAIKNLGKQESELDYPDLDAGVRGMGFLGTVHLAMQKGSWVDLNLF
ncbi:oxidoreductase [Legionella busanensis]|uniref:Oxidoreductase n=1 Tax=Legionella busanensis TaxID=190655 RepID=A0A378JND4_9GAMM|nr:Gfo/Idh/MocA family oxidoreductase [Legionella busanensis]STX51709.1 oxidoreductase [Legionella busanensis]